MGISKRVRESPRTDVGDFNAPQKKKETHSALTGGHFRQKLFAVFTLAMLNYD